ncbi:MAG: putative ATP-dependent RNA helicase dhr2 [Pycnora praestabilis]|nr:MAG: putative ATP-dependent RNA helicase dhr2 [Pycnora praestabilis]
MLERVHQRLDSLGSSSEGRQVSGRTANEASPALIRGQKRKRDDRHGSKSSGSEIEREKDFAPLPQTDFEEPRSGGTPVDMNKENAAGKPMLANGTSKQKSSLSSSYRTSKDYSQGGNLHQPSRAKGQLLEKSKSLLPIRKALPIWSHRDEIHHGLREKDVMLLVGETGSGKSTQVPQFLIEEPWCKRRQIELNGHDGAAQEVSVGGCIAITEPRRVAAISLARRVAEEMGQLLGSSSPSSTVGYSVRFDNSTTPSTRIKFLTEGMLLQEMLRDPWLRQYSAVIVDEIHERGTNVDLVAGFLRNVVTGKKEGRGGIPLKVAVMSATADMEGLLKFFDEGFHSASSVSGTDSDSESEWSGISDDEEGTPGSSSIHQQESSSQIPAAVNGNKCTYRDTHGNGSTTVDGASQTYREEPNGLNHGSKDQGHVTQLVSENVSICYIEGRQFPVKISYAPVPVDDFVDASLRTIFQIHYKEPMPGDILVFLTGQDTVEALETLVNEYALGMGPEVPKVLVLPLFAALPQMAQQRVFQPAPRRTRKIILATNIAETSVTVSGVRYVIDCGKAKMKLFRTRLGLDSLLVKPVSKSAAIQRKGRAGREAPGQCYRLYTEQDYLKLEPSNTPEILRCDLSQAILTMKARGVTDILGFPFLDRPPREALEKALLQLLQLGTLDDNGKISDVGQQIARLPLAPPLARVLLAAAEPDLNCLLEVIDIISSLSVENMFLNLTTEEKKEEAESARRELYRREGDHLTMLAAVQAYAAENSDRRAWAARHFVSHRAMQNVMDVRKQLRVQCQHLRLLKDSDSQQQLQATTTSDRASSILKAFLKGFGPNTARLFPDGSYKTMVGNQTVAIHPSSVMFSKKVEAIMYNEFVFTNRTYARGVSAVQMDWIRDAPAYSS